MSNETPPRRRRRPWTAEEEARLIAAYPDQPTWQVAEMFGRTLHQIYHKADTLGLKKSPAFFDSQRSGRLRPGAKIGGIETRFKPGHTTWNKGMKGLHIGGIETRFKPGNRTGKARDAYQPIGTERSSKDGYLQRKINDDLPLQARWRAVHLLMWEEVHGPIPPNHAVIFKDGDKQNIALDNLECISRAELMRRNSVHQYGEEIARLVQLKGAITRQINQRSKT